jgi:hypothetical protein
MRGPSAPYLVVSNIVQLPSIVHVGIPRCFLTYSSIVPTKTSVGFSPTPWNFLNLWCGTQWNLLMLLLIPWSLLYMPVACCLCLKLNNSSCCSSSALFQSIVSCYKHKKNFECKRTTTIFGCGLQRRSLKKRILLNPAHLREKPIWKIIIVVETWDKNLYCHEKSGDISYSLESMVFFTCKWSSWGQIQAYNNIIWWMSIKFPHEEGSPHMSTEWL